MSSYEEIAAVVQRAVRGETPVHLVDEETWDEKYAGNVEFDIDGYRFVIFNDCDTFDYIDYVVFPDGLKADMDELPLDGIDTGRFEALLKAAVRL